MKRRSWKSLKVGDEDLLDVVIYTKTLWSRSLTFDKNMDLLLLQENLHHEVEKRDRSGRENWVSEVTRLVAKYLHRKSNLVGDIWEE